MVRARSREERGGSPFKGDMASLGKHGSWDSRTEAKVPVPKDIAVRLGITEGELCVCTQYEFLADGKPVQLTTSWEPYSLTAGTVVVLPEGCPLVGAGAMDRMAEIGIRQSRGRITRALSRDRRRSIAPGCSAQRAGHHHQAHLLQRRGSRCRNRGHPPRHRRDRLRGADQPLKAGASVTARSIVGARPRMESVSLPQPR